MESSFQNYYGEGTASAVSFFSSHIVSVNKTQSKGEKLMTIMNEGEIIINDKTRAGEVAQIFVAAGIYNSVEKVPVYEDDGTTPDEAGISVHEVFGDIEPALQEAADKCKEAGITLNGQICYSGDYDGRYYITDNVVEDLSVDEVGVREASNEELIAELQRRGLEVMVQESKPSESSKSEDLPALCAYDIKWDTDGDEEILDSLPKEIRIPDGMVDDDEISDYLSDETGFCHAGFKLGIIFRGKIMPCNTNWLDDDTFQMWFGEGIFKDYEGDSYLLKLEKHLKDNEWVVEIIWEDDCTTINRICNADDYITANEIWKIERICEKMIQPDSDEVPETDGKESSGCSQEKNPQKLEIDRMLTISSLHVSADTKDLLDQAVDDNEEDPMPPVYEKQGYGWFVACDFDNEETWDNYPADLVQCMELAKENGCFWLCLDADGPRVDTLKIFE